MKKLILITAVLILAIRPVYSQCVGTCSNYAVLPISYSLFPTGGVNCIPLFSPSIDDGITAPIPIGFSFNFYCTTYTNVLVCSNGFIQFDIGSPPPLAFSNPAQAFPDVTVPNGMVAFNMGDFDPNMGGTITYTTIGLAPNRMFIATYSNVPMWNYNTSINSGQIVLYETTNIIEIHSASVNTSQTSFYPGTQGIENEFGTLGAVTNSGRSVSTWYTTSSDAYRFIPASPLPVTAITGTASTCEGLPHSYTATTMPGATSYQWYLPAGWTGTSNISTVTGTAGISGQLSVTVTYTCGTSTVTTLSVTVIPSPTVSITSATPNIFCSGAQVTITTAGASTYTLQPGNLMGVPPFFDTPLQSTTYTLTGIDLTGCESKNLMTVNITVKETPTVTVNNGTVCLGGSFTISPTGANSYVYSSVFPVVTPAVPSIYTYSVTGTSTNGCVGEVAISNLTVFALPTVAASSTRTAICIKEKTTLTATGAVTYQWGSGPNTSTYQVGPLSTTVYTVSGVNANGCVGTGSLTVSVSACTGIGEIETVSLVNIYPNPFVNDLTIELISACNIQIYNSLGELVFDKQLDQGHHKLDISTFARGNYFLTAEDGERKTRQILVKQ